MTLVKYGCIFVSAGVMITGALLWDSGNRRALGESEAELLAAANERRQIAYGFAHDYPDFSNSNLFVSARKQWSLLYGHTMAEARNMIIGGDSSVLWIEPDAEIRDGDMIALSGGHWVINPNGADYTVFWSGPTNADASVHSSGSRINNEATRLMPGVPTNNILPVVDAFYTGASYAITPIFGGSFNWWRLIGIGGDVYKWGCEEWRGIDGDEIVITMIGGTGFSNNFDRITAPSMGGSVSGLKFFSTSESTNLLLAAAYKLSAPGRDDAYVVLSDGAGAVSPGIYFSARTITVARGSTVKLGIHPATNSGGWDMISWDVFGAGVSALLDGSDYFFWGGSGPPWSATKYMNVIGLASGSPADAAAVIRFTLLSQPAVYHYVAVRVVSADADDSSLSATPVLSSVSKRGSAAVTVAVTASTNIFMVTDQRVLTNNLVEAKAAFDSLRRTMVVFNPDAIAYEERLRTRYLHSHSEFATEAKKYGFSDASGHHAGGPYTDDVIINQGAYDARDLAQINVHIDVGDVDGDVPSSQYNYSHDYITHQLSGCYLPYPSGFAFESNYVARVRIYLCLAGSLCVRFGTNNPDSWVGDDNLISAVLHNNQPWFYEAYTYGVWEKLCSRNDGFTYIAPNQIGHPKYNWSTNQRDVNNLAGLRLFLVVDEEAPTERPSFDIGSAIFDYNLMLSKADFQAQEITYKIGDSTYFNGYYDHNNRVWIAKVVVIVDWNWRHCNPDQPFEPDENIPEWMQ